MAHDSRLPAVMDIAPADNMRTDGSLGPPLNLGLADRISLRLSSVFYPFCSPFIFIIRLQVFSQRNARTLGIGNFTIFNDPTFGPMRPHHTLLISRRGRPRGSRLLYSKAGKGYISHSRFVGIKTVSADIDFHTLPVGILALEIGVNFCKITILTGKPLVNGKGWIPGSLIYFRMQNSFQGLRFIHGLTVEIHLSCVNGDRSVIPVACYYCSVRIIRAKKAIGDPDHPDVSLIFFPVLHHFCAGNHSSQRDF